MNKSGCSRQQVLIDAAEAQGFTVDTHVNPPIAYKGPRFSPTAWMTLRVEEDCSSEPDDSELLSMETKIRVTMEDETTQDLLVSAKLPSSDDEYFDVCVLPRLRALGIDPDLVQDWEALPVTDPHEWVGQKWWDVVPIGASVLAKTSGYVYFSGSGKIICVDCWTDEVKGVRDL